MAPVFFGTIWHAQRSARPLANEAIGLLITRERSDSHPAVARLC
jgi:hypothetical protein